MSSDHGRVWHEVKRLDEHNERRLILERIESFRQKTGYAMKISEIAPLRFWFNTSAYTMTEFLRPHPGISTWNFWKISPASVLLEMDGVVKDRETVISTDTIVSDVEWEEFSKKIHHLGGRFHFMGFKRPDHSWVDGGGNHVLMVSAIVPKDLESVVNGIMSCM